MISLTRRQVIIAGLATPLFPAVSFAAAQGRGKPERFVLSGRILRGDGKPLAGATLAVGGHPVVTDADGRFVVVTDTRAASGFASGAQRDSEGTWRATLALTLDSAAERSGAA
jgi:protocatechuate 3,4-dioxygenase beta subunit